MLDVQSNLPRRRERRPITTSPKIASGTIEVGSGTENVTVYAPVLSAKLIASLYAKNSSPELGMTCS